jgi:hypothetical protein
MTDSTETDIAKLTDQEIIEIADELRNEETSIYRNQNLDWLVGRGARAITQLRAERDAAARDMQERCAKIVQNNMLCGSKTEILMPRAAGNNVGMAYARAMDALAVVTTEGKTS